MYMYMHRCLCDRWIEQLADVDVMRFLFLDPASCCDSQCKENFSDAVSYVTSFFCAITDSSDIIFLPYIQK